MTLPDPPEPTLRLKIDRDALAANWQLLDRMSGVASAGAAVKADAYGLGVDIVVPVLAAAGARQFFVAHWSEVAGVRAHVSGAQIAVLHGAGSEQEAAYARETGAVPVINSLHQAQIWQTSGGGSCHLMVDTGINRLGVPIGQTGDPVIRALAIDTLLSHLASADEDVALNGEQLTAFRAVAQALPARQVSLANSAGIALGADYHFDLTRPGLALFGGRPRAEFEGRIAQVAFPQAAVIQTGTVQAGDAVGYNATWRAKRQTQTATVSAGYADGIMRAWADGGALQHGEWRLPILGRVSMDMIVLDCTGCQLREGDFVNIPYDLPIISAATAFSQYELLTLLGNRFERS